MPSNRANSDTADRGRGRGKVAKRSCNACARCRAQKIKCSGSLPCEACKKRKLPCNFDDRDQKILVTKGYLVDLQRQIESQRQNEAVNNVIANAFDALPNSTANSPVQSRTSPMGPAQEPQSQAIDTNEPGSTEELQIDAPRSTDLDHDRESLHDPVASSLTNPLSTGPSTFMTSSDGRAHYLGTSSNWSFSRRVINLAHEYVHRSPIAADSLLFDSAAYELGWDGSRVSEALDIPALPSLDHTIYLINTVKFHCTQVFHLFDEELFMDAMYDFYANPDPKIEAAELDYIHLLLVIAFGKALVDKIRERRRPPGSHFFVRALQLLPDAHVLSRQPVISSEILCCIALYFQSLDFRNSAHIYIGQAMRIALAHGMHTIMPTQHLGQQLVERCRRIWWTIYVMDREMTSLMGLPQSIHDGDIQTELPSFAGSTQKSAALSMHIRISQNIATINRGIYGADGRLNKTFLTSTKGVLNSIAGLVDELRYTFPMQTEKISINGVPRISAYLHLLYHQCIVLATRPLLLCFLKIRFESPESYLEALGSSRTVWNLIKMCMESSQQMINILTVLQNQGLLETFLPFNLEPLFVSGLNLILGTALDTRLLESPYMWLEKAYDIFDEFVRSGNLIADFRRCELKQLEDILSSLPEQFPLLERNTSQPLEQNQVDSTRPDNAFGNEMDSNSQSGRNQPRASGAGFSDFLALESEMTAAQLTDMANSIANSDTEWMQYAIMEHSIW